MTRPVHASDVKNLRRCKRLATLSRRCERQPARPGSAAALGTLVHAAIETYVRTGDMPDERTRAGRIALELVPHVPAVVLGAEVPFAVTWRGYPLGGTIDLVAPELVIDWKTIGEWTRMLATLAGDPQATWYSYAHAASGGGAPALRWVYAHSRTLQTRKLDGEIDPARIADFEAEIVELLTLDSVADPLSVEGNRQECTRYGGCTFLGVCGSPSPADRFARVQIGGAR